jgi:hypothetical protein
VHAVFHPNKGGQGTLEEVTLKTLITQNVGNTHTLIAQFNFNEFVEKAQKM